MIQSFKDGNIGWDPDVYSFSSGAIFQLVVKGRTETGSQTYWIKKTNIRDEASREVKNGEGSPIRREP